jgi:hypothetical protein
MRWAGSARARGPALAAAALVAAGCAPAPAPAPAPPRTVDAASCPGGESRPITLLFFGMASDDGRGVSEQAWETFLREVVTPKFPEGFTAFPARGQYADREGSVVEATRVVLRVRDDNPTGNATVAAIIAEYKRRFQQRSVLRIDFPACVAF